MNIELDKKDTITTIRDLEMGDTFLHRGTKDYTNDSVFIVTNTGWVCKAVDLETGEEICLEEDEIVIPIKVKVVSDT